jgi:hypothetical protein
LPKLIFFSFLLESARPLPVQTKHLLSESRQLIHPRPFYKTFNLRGVPFASDVHVVTASASKIENRFGTVAYKNVSGGPNLAIWRCRIVLLEGKRHRGVRQK